MPLGYPSALMRSRLIALSVVAAAAAAFASSARPAGPLETGFVDPFAYTDKNAELAFARTQAAGATVVRIIAFWRVIAPRTRPRGFDPANPGDRAYRWEVIDPQVRRAVARGLKPIVSVQGGAPDWAEGTGDGPVGTRRPNPEEYAKFAVAIARRYSGSFEGLPRIRYWQAWNEPNLAHFLSPQSVDGEPFAAFWYRRMLNAFSDAVKSVHSDNVVGTAGTAPFTSPLVFLRQLFCLSRTLEPTCSQEVRVDAVAHHPYTSGGPTREAYDPENVSLGDLPELRRLVNAAVATGNLKASRPVQLWVTEFSWDSNPPDPNGVPAALHTRWVAEGLYRMWANGVNVLTWFLLRDDPPPSWFQSGLYYRGDVLANDRPKPALAAFRFPLVAFPARGAVFVWGRTPGSRAGRVVVEQSFRGGWKRLGIVRTDRYGIFHRRFRSRPTGFVRGRVFARPDRAVPFSLRQVPDRYFGPFGVPLEPEK